jgi:hypothetical protein
MIISGWCNGREPDEFGWVIDGKMWTCSEVDEVVSEGWDKVLEVFDSLARLFAHGKDLPLVGEDLHYFTQWLQDVYNDSEGEEVYEI